MTIIERNMFLGANTPDGFVGYFHELAGNWGLKKLVILKGGSGVGKSTFMRKFAEHFIREGRGKTSDKKRVVYYMYCASDPASLDGVLIEDLGVAIIDGTAPHMVDPKYPGLVDEIVDLAQFLDGKKLGLTLEQLQSMQEVRKAEFVRAYGCLNNARNIHMKVEESYVAAMDWDGVDAKLAEVIKSV